MTVHDESFMNICLTEARKGLGYTSPNPLVGAVVVKNGEILATGYHAKQGQEHAEVAALAKLTTDQTEGATLYVNLEPCCHWANTPPCVEAVQKAKITRVVIANEDPDERVKGQGIQTLQEAGISVTTGVLEKEARELNSIYFHFKSEKRPYVVLKAALTLDGRIATSELDSKWISSAGSRKLVHQMRRRLRAIAVGKNTIIQDKPRLNCRLEGFESKPIDKLVFTDSEDIPLTDEFKDNDGRIFILGKDFSPLRDEFLDFCRNENIDSIMVEGGSEVFTWFVDNELVDRVFVFFKPSFLGEDGIPVTRMRGISRISQLKELQIIDTKVIENTLMVDMAKGEPLCLLD